MGRVYTVEETAAVTAAGDILELTIPSDAVGILRRFEIGQNNITASDQVEYSITRVTGSPTVGTGGTTPTLRPVSPGDASAGITARTFATGDLTGGTSVVLATYGFNLLSGHVFPPDPIKELPEFSPGTYCLIVLNTNPAASTNFVITATVEEIGG